MTCWMPSAGSSRARSPAEAACSGKSTDRSPSQPSLKLGAYSARMRARSGRTPALVGLALAAAMAVSAGLILFWGSKLTFLLDDWEFLLYRPGFSAHSILEPHGEHISIAPILIYKGLLGSAGMSSSM